MHKIKVDSDYILRICSRLFGGLTRLGEQSRAAPHALQNVRMSTMRRSLPLLTRVGTDVSVPLLSWTQTLFSLDKIRDCRKKGMTKERETGGARVSCLQMSCKGKHARTHAHRGTHTR